MKIQKGVLFMRPVGPAGRYRLSGNSDGSINLVLEFHKGEIDSIMHLSSEEGRDLYNKLGEWLEGRKTDKDHQTAADLYEEDWKGLPPGAVAQVAVDRIVGKWFCHRHGREVMDPVKHKYHYLG